MPTVDELLAQRAREQSEAESGFTTDTNYKSLDYSDSQVIHIKNKAIGDMQQQVSVQGEINSQYIVFEHERYMDGQDLTKTLIQIHYERSDGQKSNSEVVNVEYSDTVIRFGWLVSQYAAELGGAIRVLPFFSGTTTSGTPYLLKDKYASYTISPSLETSEWIVEPNDETWYQQFVSDVLALRNYTNDAESSALKAKEYENNAKNYMEQTRQLSVANVGEMTFSINTEKNCLSVSYQE